MRKVTGFNLAEALRRNDGKTQREWAKAMDVSLGTIVALEGGESLAPKRGTSRIVRLIESFYGLPLSKLQAPYMLPAMKFRTKHRHAMARSRRRV